MYGVPLTTFFPPAFSSIVPTALPTLYCSCHHQPSQQHHSTPSGSARGAFSHAAHSSSFSLPIHRDMRAILWTPANSLIRGRGSSKGFALNIVKDRKIQSPCGQTYWRILGVELFVLVSAPFFVPTPAQDRAGNASREKNVFSWDAPKPGQRLSARKNTAYVPVLG